MTRRTWLLGGMLLVALVLGCSRDDSDYTPIDIDRVPNSTGELDLNVVYEQGKPRLSWTLPKNLAFRYSKIAVFRAEFEALDDAAAEPSAAALPAAALPAAALPAAALPSSGIPGGTSVTGVRAFKYSAQDYSEERHTYEEIARISGSATTYLDAKTEENLVYLYRIMAIRGGSFLVSRLTNRSSTDRDGDGRNDDRDVFPDNPSEWRDLDRDGVGDAADLDDDGDGVPDFVEARESLDPSNPDTDGDGIPDAKDLAANEGKFAVYSLSPSRGFVTGGISVEVRGENFPADLSVRFGTKRATITAVEAGRCTVTVPQGEAGTVDVVLSRASEPLAVLRGAFRYFIPGKLPALFLVEGGKVATAPILSLGQQGVRLCLVVENSAETPVRVYDWDGNGEPDLHAVDFRPVFTQGEAGVNQDYSVRLERGVGASNCLVPPYSEAVPNIEVNPLTVLPGNKALYSFLFNISPEAGGVSLQETGSVEVGVGARTLLLDQGNRMVLDEVLSPATFTLTELSELDYELFLAGVEVREDGYVLSPSVAGEGLVVVEGQPFAVVLEAQNKGFAPFRDLTFEELVLSGSGEFGKLGVLERPDPEILDLPGKSKHAFTFIFQAGPGGRGSYTFSSNLSGRTSAGEELALPDRTSGELQVLTPARLVVTEAQMPAALNVGQSGGEVVLSVSNFGESAASLTGLTLHLFDQEHNFIPDAPVRFLAAGANAKSLIGGGSVQLRGTLGLKAQAQPGAYLLAPQVAGTDSHSNVGISSEVTDAATPFRILAPARIAVRAVRPSTSTISQGRKNFAIEVEVENLGDAAALLVELVPTMVNQSGTDAGQAFLGRIAENSPTSVAGKQQSVFLLEVDVAATAPAGTYQVTARARCRDVNDGSLSEHDSALDEVSGTFSVIRPAELEVTDATLSTVVVSQGQSGLILSFTGTNLGSEDILLSPVEASFALGTVDHSYDYLLFPDPTNPVLLEAGESAQFKATLGVLEDATPGQVQVFPRLLGAGAISGQQIADTPPTALVLSVKQRATLSCNLLFARSPLTEGQDVALTVRVTNSGEASALAAELDPLQLVPTGTGRVTYLSGPLPLSAAIPGGTSKDFAYVYSTGQGSTGSLNFAVRAEAIDQYSQLAVASESATAALELQTQARVEVLAVNAAQTLVSRGQNTAVTLRVRNLGTAALRLDESMLGLSFTDPAQNDRAADYQVQPAFSSEALLLPGLGSVDLPFTVSVVSTATVDTVITVDGRAGGKDLNNDAVTSDSTATVKAAWEVKTPARIVLDSLQVGPQSVNQGQTGLPVALNVSNPGGAPLELSAAGLVLRDASNSDVSSQFTVAPSFNNPELIPGAGSVTLSFTLGVSSTASSGLVTLDAVVTGKDQLSGNTMTANGATTKDTILVQTPARLQSTLTATPTPLSEGQTLTVQHLVTNLGEATARTVLPGTPILSGQGHATLVSGPLPASADLAGGQAQVFSYTYATTSGSAGTLTFSAVANGTDANVATAVSSQTASSGVVTIQSPAKLEVLAVLSTKAKLSLGQRNVPVTVSVRNPGQASVAITSAGLTLRDRNGNDVAAEYQLTTVQAPTSLAGGLSTTYDYTLTVDAAATLGDVILDFGIRGQDQNSGLGVQDLAADSPLTVTVQTPAALTVQAVSTAVETISQGQQNVQVQMTVVNGGQAGATLNALSLSFTKDGGSVGTDYTVVPAPSNPTTIAGLQTSTFIFSVSCGATATRGGVVFDGSVSGADGNSGSPLTASGALNPDSWTVQSPAVLEVVSVASNYDQAVRRQRGLDLLVTARNTGEAGATLGAVTLFIGALGGQNRLAEYTVTAAPGNPTGLAGGVSAVFSYSLEVSANATLGPMTLDATLSGSDVNSGLAKSDTDGATAKDLWTVVRPAVLEGSFALSRTRISEGQDLSVTFSVRNNGDIDALAVTPASLTLNGVATPVSGPIPASATIVAGAEVAFVYQFLTGPGSAGNLDFSGTATGTDQVLATTVTSTPLTSGPVTVQTPANLRLLSVSAVPSTITKVSRGQQEVLLRAVVQNSGQATATIGSVELDFTSSALVDVTSEYELTKIGHASSIPGGSSASFDFRVEVGSAATLGNITVDATATGTDANWSSRALADDGADTPDLLEVQTPPQVELQTVSTVQTQVSQGQQGLAVAVTAANLGGATVNVGTVALTFQGSIDRTADYLVTPSPANPASIVSGQTANFAFTVTVKAAAAAEVIVLDGTFVGTDANSGTQVRDDDGASTTDAWTVVRPALLRLGTVNALKSAVVRAEQGLVVNVGITNEGGATANLGASSLRFSQSGNDLGTEYTVTPSGANPGTLGSGQAATLVFTVDVASAATLGNVALDAAIVGTDANSGAALSDPAAETTDTWTVRSPAILVATAGVDRLVLSEGQTLSVTVTVNNTGQTDALLVNPDPTLTLTGSGSATLGGPPGNTGVTIPAGGSAAFVYAYSTDGTSAGNLVFSGKVEGVNDVLGTAVVSTTASSPTVMIQEPAGLGILSVTASPQRVSQGQGGITVNAVIANPGQARALLSTAQLAFTGSIDRGGDYVVTPAPANPTSINGGGQVTLAYTVAVRTTAAVGEAIALDAAVTGSDENSGAVLQDSSAATPDQWLVEVPAAIEVVSVSVVPGTVSQGQSGVPLSVAVRNNGQAVLDGLAVQVGFVDAQGLGVTSQYVLTPVPGNPTSVAGGGSATLSYTMTVGGTATAGLINATATAVGQDRNSGAATSDATRAVSDSFTVQRPAMLEILSVTLADEAVVTVSKGQTGLLVNLVGRNSGGVRATSLAADLQFKAANGNLKNTDFTVLADGGNPTFLESGASGTFAFTVTVKGTAASGPTTVDGALTGTDANSGATLSDDAASTSDQVTVQTPAVVTLVSVTESYQNVSQGQTDLALTLSVNNPGQATALVGTIAPVLKDGLGNDLSGSDYSIVAAPDNPVSIVGGATSTFGFTLAVAPGATTGGITLDGRVTASDANTLAPLSDTSATTTGAFTVQTPAQLRVNSVTTTPLTVSRGQQNVLVTVNVSNPGQATATIGSTALGFTDALAVNRNNDYTVTPGENPSSIAGAASANLTYRFAVGTVATLDLITLDARVTGSDQNSGAALLDNGADSTDAFTVQTSASLEILSVSCPASTAVRGQTGLPVTVAIRNNGQATATFSSLQLALTRDGGNVDTEFIVAVDPANPTSLAGGATLNFLFDLTVGGSAVPGNVILDAVAVAADANTGGNAGDSGAGQPDSLLVKTPASLELLTVAASRAQVSRGQTGLGVTVTVRNNGTSTALIGSSSLRFTLGGDVGAQYSVVAAPGNPTQVEGSAQTTFQYTVEVSSAATAGALVIDASVGGTDQLSGAATSDLAAATPASVQVQTNPVLDLVSATCVPASVSRGQTGIPCTVVLRNTGQASAVLSEVALSFTNSALQDVGAQFGTTPSPANPTSLAGGASASFSFTVDVDPAAGSGDIAVDARASGSDVNSLAAVTDLGATTADLVVVQTPAAVAINSVSSAVLQASPGQTGILVTVGLTNSGEATANLDGLTLNVRNDAGVGRTSLYEQQLQGATGVLVGGQSRTFSFLLGVKTTAIVETVNLFAVPVATDANSGAIAAVSGTSVKHILAVLAPATLHLEQLAFPALLQPYRVSKGQSGISVTALVRNTGQVTANLGSGGLSFALGGQDRGLDYQVEPDGSNAATLAGGATTILTYQVTVTSTALVGTVVVDASISGSDALSGLTVTDAGVDVPPSWVVQTPAALAITAVSTVSTSVSRGQDGLAVGVTVRNNGTAGADTLVATLIFKDGLGNTLTPEYTITADPGNPTSLAGGAVGTFDFTVALSSGATLGSIKLLASVTGRDVNTGLGLADAPTGIYDTWTVQVPASLGITSVGVDPLSVSQGQQDFVVTVEVENTGGAEATLAALNLTFTTLAGMSKTSQYTVSAVPGNPESITGGGTETFTFAVDVAPAATTGTLRADATVQGSDANSGALITDLDGASSTDTFLVQTPAVLILSSVQTAPTEVSRGQQGISVSMVVENSGQATASISGSGLSIFDQNQLERTGLDYQLQNGANPTSLPGGGTGTFTFTLGVKSTAQTGSMTLDGWVQGTDANSGAVKNDTAAASPDTFLVRGGAQLSIASVSTVPATVSRGQTGVEVLLQVTNTGDAQAVLGGSSLVLSDAANNNRSNEYTVVLTNPVATLAAGQSAVLDFEVSLAPNATTGPITLDGSVAGTDANSGVTIGDISAAVTDVFQVQTPAVLSVGTVSALPATVSREQSGIVVTAQVSNTGQAQATGLATTLLFRQGQADVGSSFTVTPADDNPTALAGGAQGTFSYTVAVAAGSVLGAVTLDARSDGTEGNTGLGIADSAAATIDVFTVQRKAGLVLDIATLAPLAVNRGQQGLSVSLGVSNPGEASAVLLSSGLTFFTGGGANVASQYTVLADPSNVGTVPGGGTVTLRYTVEVSSSATLGTINLDGALTGSDANSGAALTDTGAASPDAFTVMVPASLALQSAATTPLTVSRGQGSIQVTLVATNPGGALVNLTGVTPTFRDAGGIPQAYTVTADPANPTFLAGAATGTFNFSLAIPADAVTGPVTLDGTISGTDANSGAVVSDGGAATTDSFTVQTAAVLRVLSLAVGPAKVSQGQNGVTVTVQVKNDGQAVLVLGNATLVFQKDSRGDVNNDYVVVAGGGNPASLSAGQAAEYTYTVQVSASAVTGLITVWPEFSGTDANSGTAAALIGGDLGDTVLVQVPAGLTVASAVTFVPASGATTDDIILIKLTVTNPGGDSALNLDPVNSLSLEGTAVLVQSGGPSPAVAGTLLGGGSQVFTYSYTATTAGDVTAVNGFSVVGVDQNRGVPLSASRNIALSPVYTIVAVIPRLSAKDLVLLASVTEEKEASQGQGGLPVTLRLFNAGRAPLEVSGAGLSLPVASTLWSATAVRTPDSLGPGESAVAELRLELGEAFPSGLHRVGGWVSFRDPTNGAFFRNDAVIHRDWLQVLTRAELVVERLETEVAYLRPGQEGVLWQVELSNRGQAPARLASFSLRVLGEDGSDLTSSLELVPIEPLDEVMVSGGSLIRLNLVVGVEPWCGSGSTSIDATLGFFDLFSGRGYEGATRGLAGPELGAPFVRTGQVMLPEAAGNPIVVQDRLVLTHAHGLLQGMLRDGAVSGWFELGGSSLSKVRGDVTGLHVLSDTGLRRLEPAAEERWREELLRDRVPLRRTDRLLALELDQDGRAEVLLAAAAQAVVLAGSSGYPPGTRVPLAGIQDALAGGVGWGVLADQARKLHLLWFEEGRPMLRLLSEGGGRRLIRIGRFDDTAELTTVLAYDGEGVNVLRLGADGVLVEQFGGEHFGVGPADRYLVADLDANGYDDLVGLRDGKLELLFNLGGWFQAVPLQVDEGIQELVLADLDSEGGHDLITLGKNGLTSWRNDIVLREGGGR